MKTKDLLKFAEKKVDPDEAALKECANIAKKMRGHVWDGPPKSQLQKKGFFANSPVVALLGW